MVRTRNIQAHRWDAINRSTFHDRTPFSRSRFFASSTRSWPATLFRTPDAPDVASAEGGVGVAETCCACAAGTEEGCCFVSGRGGEIGAVKKYGRRRSRGLGGARGVRGAFGLDTISKELRFV